MFPEFSSDECIQSFLLLLDVLEGCPPLLVSNIVHIVSTVLRFVLFDFVYLRFVLFVSVVLHLDCSNVEQQESLVILCLPCALILFVP